MKRKLKVSKEVELHLEEMRAVLAPLPEDDISLSREIGGDGCGGYCRYTCSYFCRPTCEASCKDDCESTCRFYCDGYITFYDSGGCVIGEVLWI